MKQIGTTFEALRCERHLPTGILSAGKRDGWNQEGKQYVSLHQIAFYTIGSAGKVSTPKLRPGLVDLGQKILIVGSEPNPLPFASS